MILPDTSIWIDHFRRGVAAVGELAVRADILMHPFVLTEISLGSLPDRAMTLRFLRRLLPPVVSSDAEVALLIEKESLFSTGLNFVDVHLLASALLTGDCQLWCRDVRLARTADRLGVGYTPSA
jgi:predicted nucleic acid-binding protein